MADLVGIIAGIVGLGVAAAAAAGIVALVNSKEEDEYVPDYDDSEDDYQEDEDDTFGDGYQTDSIWEDQDTEEQWNDMLSDDAWNREHINDVESVQREFDYHSQNSSTEYLYIDFTENLKVGSKNRNDVYLESIEEQFGKLQRKLALYGKNEITDLNSFVRCCFPSIRSTYYVSLPGFDRRFETVREWEYIYNMVIRPEKTGIAASMIPKELDVILVGDLVFRNNIITFQVKGLDLIDVNVEKFGELRIECAAACAITRNTRNLPDFGLEGRDLYKSFLTRDSVLSLCEKVYPIENPEKAIAIFEEWKKYIGFRKYYLEVLSQRNEGVDRLEYMTAYAVSRSEYRKNEEFYAEHLLDGFKGFIQREHVLLDEKTEDAVEFPLIKVEISRKLAAINKELARDNKTSRYEIELRRFSKTSLALSANDPADTNEAYKREDLLYLGDRVAFETVDVPPDCTDIDSFFDERIRKGNAFIDNKYKNIITEAINEFRKSEEKRSEEAMLQDIQEYAALLDRNLASDISDNTDRSIAKRYAAKIKDIDAKYKNLRKQLEKAHKAAKAEDPEYDEQPYETEALALNEKEQAEKNSIPLSDWYAERNEKLKENYANSRRLQRSKDLESICGEKKTMLQSQLSPEIEREKREYKETAEKERETEIRKKKEKLTKRHFYIYFKAEEIGQPDAHRTDILSEKRFLTFDNRAEKKKIERQEKAIYSFYHGYVKNPFLSSYFFVPETLGQSEHDPAEIEWFGSRLNDSQKEAVRRALASNSVFLLQGPPGTGKTEVISEITAQCVKQGKKVLVSSETHKAIDNVFERLPKIPEIRPLRLVPSLSNKETEYSPEKLVDNLYLSISSTLQKRIRQYENFTEMKDHFNEKMSELRFRHSQLLELETKCRSVQTEKASLQREMLEYDQQAEIKRAARRPLEEEKEQYEILLSCMDKGDFNEEIEKSDILRETGQSLYKMAVSCSIFTEVTYEKVSMIYSLDPDAVREEFKKLENGGAAMKLEQEKAVIRAKVNALRDPDTLDILEGKEEEFEQLKKQLLALKNITPEENSSDLSELSITRLVRADKLADSVSREQTLQELTNVQSRMKDFVISRKKSVNELLGTVTEKLAEIDNAISKVKIEKNNALIKIEELNEDASYSDFRRKQQELRKAIADFFTDFEIYDEYLADDFAYALDIIGRRWKELEKNQDTLEAENRSRIPMYRSICDYLKDEEILEEDRVSYTKKLFDNANVFGMTCTSREYYSEASMRALREYKLGNINIRNVGIDVVIIDEVSKSSFLDLLIPVLYGKTVILVGDHRQLPPLYDLKHMRQSDFENLDREIIDYSLNKHYQKLYETCFFKELFERVPDAYKIMLDKQYRCHSDIMDVFNHFYSVNGTGLTVGTSNQNDLKQHGLLIRSRGMTLIEPNNHIYFINCTANESRLDSESSSIVNIQESEVVCELLKLIDEQYGVMLASGELKRNGRKDERKSVGVICTYRDQAQHIKKGLKGVKFRNFSDKREERLVINTVDDFQGDERDIIIVSMVRNPKGDRYNTDFIDQFERINVALSRARCMLVIVGSQDFLSRSSIDLPDINGRKELDRHSFPVYREIIRTIQAKGKLLQASDIIGEEKKHGK